MVLKAPHHGSATSSTQDLLDRLRPRVVIFSCGRNNRFGHPHPVVVDRFRALGSAIFSTAEDGAVFCGDRWEGWRSEVSRAAAHNRNAHPAERPLRGNFEEHAAAPRLQ